MEAHFLGQVFQVFYFNVQNSVPFSIWTFSVLKLVVCIQVGQGEIKWKECAKQSLLRDRVMEKLPKDEAGWPKTMSPEEEASFLETLSEEERHCMVGLGGSQKAEVAWMEANGIAFERLDVEVFFANNPSGATRANAGIGQKVAATSTKYVIESFGQKVAATSTKYVIESFSSSSDHCMTNPMVRSSTTCNVNPGKANCIQRFCFSNPIHHASTDAPTYTMQAQARPRAP
jgi:hypothetical protein